MKMETRKILLLAITFLLFSHCDNNFNDTKSTNTITEKSTQLTLSESTGTKENTITNADNGKITFIELGSVKCIPCRMMQPIIAEIEKEYADSVKVIFYDVWTPEGGLYARQYQIRVIPTQVFLDRDGKEYYRHEGFFAKEEIVKVLKMKEDKK